MIDRRSRCPPIICVESMLKKEPVTHAFSGDSDGVKEECIVLWKPRREKGIRVIRSTPCLGKKGHRAKANCTNIYPASKLNVCSPVTDNIASRLRTEQASPDILGVGGNFIGPRSH